MSLFINGADQDTFTMNGTAIDNLYVDSVLVFSSGEAIAPNAPTNFAASDDEAEQITFTWDNSTVGFPTPTYDIYRFNQPLLIAANVTSPHTEALEEGTNDYLVRAINSEGQADSNVDSGTSIPGDETIPVITMLGTSPVEVEVYGDYIDAGATALDDVDGDITSDIITNNGVLTDQVGAYLVTYNVSDSSGNEAVEVRRSVNIVATGINEPPVITILGDNPATVVAGETYIDEGATAMDPQDGDLTSEIQTVSNVDINIEGNYTVTYEVSDSDNNTTIKIRNVNVVEEIYPPSYDFVQPLIDGGDGYMYVEDVANHPYEKHNGKLCLENGDAYIPTEQEYPGNGTLDLSLNRYIGTSWIPTDSPYEWTMTEIYEVNNSYTQYTYHYDGVDKLDVYIGSNDGTTRVPVAYSHSVQPYALNDTEWIITDTPPESTDVTPPVITMLGFTPVDVEVGTPYVDAGATAWDDRDGDVTADIVTVNNVDVDTIAAYNITYNVDDSAGNSAVEVTRVVNVNAVSNLGPELASDVTMDTNIFDGIWYRNQADPSIVWIENGEAEMHVEGDTNCQLKQDSTFTLDAGTYRMAVLVSEVTDSGSGLDFYIKGYASGNRKIPCDTTGWYYTDLTIDSTQANCTFYWILPDDGVVTGTYKFTEVSVKKVL